MQGRDLTARRLIRRSIRRALMLCKVRQFLSQRYHDLFVASIFNGDIEHLTEVVDLNKQRIIGTTLEILHLESLIFGIGESIWGKS